MNRTIFPEYPKPGATIGIVALSSPSIGTRKPRILSALKALEDDGYKIKLGKTALTSGISYKSASLRDRADDLNEMLQDPEIEIILNTTGGYNSNELLEFIDYQAMRSKPRWFVGYSDITAVNLAIFSQCGVATAQGCMLIDYSDWPECFIELLTCLGLKQRELVNQVESWTWERTERILFKSPTVLDGKISESTGRLVAGNLSTFNLLLGTKYIPSLKQAFLFLEYDKEEDKALPSLERFLWQLRQAPDFKDLAGLVFGKLPPAVSREETPEWNIAKLLATVTDGFEFPVIFDAQIGHFYPSWQLVNGQRVAFKDRRLTILAH